MRRIEKVADAIALAGMPVLHGWQYVIGCVAVGAREQFERIHEDDLVQGVIGSECALQAHKGVWLVIAERDFPDLGVARIV
ncbi:hypothetical protein MAFF211479_01180 [Ralstonia solanacearum]|nr:hypothetical protein MAFF211479_01180 [Ralstonia solanacearum]BCL95765.1 hypothetical protein MAFF211491_02170 [Ralstonia solanacearum]BCM11027.1 hypothetical protein MAFF241648_02170 [Ralstonia solanacearum]BCN02981.1 hypothetical protein RPSB_01180 [Ralstonia solanacearum]